MADLKGKGAFLTGGAMGIGRAVLDTLLSRGARVLFCDVDEEIGHQTMEELLSKFDKSDVMFVHCDVSDQAQLTDAFQRAVKEFGAVEICINNAGIMGEQNYEKMTDVNQVAVIRGSYLALEHMRKDKGGRGGIIISTASVNGLYFGQHMFPCYLATKRAVVGFCTSWANSPDQPEHGVRWGVVCPDATVTPLTTGSRKRNADKSDSDANPRPPPDRSRWLKPADVASAFMTLIDDDDSNGYVIKVSRDREKENAPVLQTILVMDKSNDPVEALSVKYVSTTPPVAALQ